MIVTLEGPQGAGKTSAAIALALRNKKRHPSREIIANLHLTIPYKYMTLEWFVENINNTVLENCILILDEMYQIADSRSSGTRMNKLFALFIAQARKRNVDIYFCTHQLSYVDLRLRNHADKRGHCSYTQWVCPVCKGSGLVSGIFCPFCKGFKKIGRVDITWINRRNGSKHSGETIYPMNNFWLYYNTRERIPITKKQLPDQESFLEVV